MISHHLKEDDGDRAVKLQLWSATERELMHFASRYAEEHVVGERASEAQEGVADAAKAKGYPKGLVRMLGSLVRREMVETPDAAALMREYRVKIGLESGRA